MRPGRRRGPLPALLGRGRPRRRPGRGRPVSILVRGVVYGLTGGPGSVLVEDGFISWVGHGKPPRQPEEVIETEPGELVAPGFLDLQVNGFCGHDAAAGPGAITAISKALPATGVTAFLPTLISAPVTTGAAFVTMVASAASPGARVLGAHLEGPFLNPSFRGAHERSCLAEPEPELVQVVAAAGPRLVTLAPELPGALAAVATLRRAGVVVSAGHTGADFEQGRRAVEAGVRFGTHLYNAMPPVHHRRPGIAEALLLDDRVTVGLIVDGEHVHPAVCESVLRIKGPMRVALTTDQTAAAGMPSGSYSLSGRPVASDGKVVRLEDGTLAGSAASMDDLLRRSAALPGSSPAQAVAMASTAPARVLGERTLGRLRVGAAGDLVVLDRELRVRLTLVGGCVRYRR
ncbi:MAG: N-acetylglucosamine-6-phosphate deacetylase [Chloroflexi bacterium]|nr:MAG: N-acetylglucosamine-6-phosphate deacetylase [Chloroflexota bacterium]